MIRLSHAQFGALAGLSRQAIACRVRKGDLELTDHKLDPRHPTNAAFLVARGISPETLQPVQAPGGAGPRQPVDDNPDTPDPEAWKRPNASRAELEREKLRRQIRKLAVETSYKENRLIDREELGKIITFIASAMISEIRTMGTSLGPEIAAATGASDPAVEIEITRLIDEGAQRVLDAIHRNVSAALKENPPEKEEAPLPQESASRNRATKAKAAAKQPAAKTTKKGR